MNDASTNELNEDLVSLTENKKMYEKEQKANLKLSCVNLAINAKSVETTSDIITMAKEIYKFVSR